MSELNRCEKERPVKYVFADSSEYPPVRVCGENAVYAREMLNNIGACDSEMSSIAGYVYNSMIATGEYEGLGEAFSKISMVEMRHLNIFGQLVDMLGGDPRLWSVNRGRYTYWTAACNQYPRNVQEILKHSYRAEEAAIEKYEWQIRHIDDRYIQEILRRIILDEKCHLKVLDQLYDRYCQ